MNKRFDRGGTCRYNGPSGQTALIAWLAIIKIIDNGVQASRRQMAREADDGDVLDDAVVALQLPIVVCGGMWAHSLYHCQI